MRRIAVTVLMSFCTLGVFGQDRAIKPATVLNSKEIQARLESYINPYFQQKDFSKAVAFGGEFSRPTALSESDAPRFDAADYAGAYRTPSVSVPLNVVQKNGKLYLQWGNYPFLRSLTPVAKDKFYYRAEYAEIIFERGSDGRIEKIKWQSSPTDSFFLTREQE